MQKEIWQKINKRFNTVNVEKEFCLLYGEVWEAFNAYNKNKDDLNEELADIAIYLIGLSEMSEFDLEDEIVKKMKKIKKELIRMLMEFMLESVINSLSRRSFYFFCN